ncbi:hypothetical protein KR054_007735, partial [Drosophila jambulina]
QIKMIFKFILCVLVTSLVSARQIPGPQERIVGGYHVFIEDVPHQVAILKYGVQTCGGAIYSERIILTAAHCLNGTNAEAYSVRAGSSFPNSGGQVVDVQEAYPHKDYDPIKVTNDIAVLYLKDPLKLNTTRTRSIELAEEPPKIGEKCMVSGWGMTYFGSSVSAPTLLAANLTISKYSLCRSKYPGIVNKDMICAYAPNADSCKGDSGGPLISLQSLKLIGIVSFGRECAVEGYPGVYASVAYFKKWILKAIDNLEN